MTSKIDDARLAGALEYWRGVNLVNMLQDLDAAGLEIVENQKTSLQQRRKLAEKTKEFRQVPDDQKATEFKPLLRLYQNEIDALTKRMKHAENSFLRVFQSLSTAPDPEPFISSLVEQRKLQAMAEDTKEENKKLRENLQKLSEDNAKLEEQGRENERLSKQVEMLQANMKEKVDELAGQREREIKEQTEDLIRHLKDREGDLQRQLSAANRALVQMQSTYESSESDRMLAKAEGADRELIGKLAELDIVQSDLEHANSRLADMQMQNAKLRSELALLADGAVDGSGGGGGGVAEALAEYKRRVRDLDDETKRLFASLEKAEAQITLQDARMEQAVSAVERESMAKDEELQRLRNELKQRADYDEIKRDLDIMKSVEFSVSDWGLEDNAGENSNAGDESLEKLLVRRNKTLENKLTDSRNELERCLAEVRKQGERCEVMERKLKEKSVLAERLEADLLRMQPNNNGSRKEEDKQSEMNPAAAAAAAASFSFSSLDNPGSGLLDIVTGQRDRFRQRNIELEDELREQTSSVNEMKRQVEQ
ncbi:hypothetical protein J3B02_004774, partial [Coemansia erecta]